MDMGHLRASCRLVVAVLVAVLLVHAPSLVAAEEPQLASGTFPFADIQVAYKMYDQADPSEEGAARQCARAHATPCAHAQQKHTHAHA